MLQLNRFQYFGLAFLIAIPICIYAYMLISHKRLIQGLSAEETKISANPEAIESISSDDIGNGSLAEEYEKVKAYLASIPDHSQLEIVQNRRNYFSNLINIINKIQNWSEEHEGEKENVLKILSLQAALDPHFKKLSSALFTHSAFIELKKIEKAYQQWKLTYKNEEELKVILYTNGSRRYYMTLWK